MVKLTTVFVLFVFAVSYRELEGACKKKVCPSGWTPVLNYCLQRLNCTTNSYTDAVSYCSTTNPPSTLFDPFVLLDDNGENSMDIVTSWIRGTLLEAQEYFYVNGHYAYGEGDNATFVAYSNGYQFSCSDEAFCHGRCNLNASDHQILFAKINQTDSCFANSPDFEYSDSIICQIKQIPPSKKKSV